MASTRNLARTGVIAALVTGFLMLLALGAGAPIAEASKKKSACARFGNVPASNLKPGQARNAIRCFTNRARNRQGLKSLRGESRLKRAAQKHTQRMKRTNCFSHQCPGEGTLVTRLRSVGYLTGGLLTWSYGENIAWGQGSYSAPRNTHQRWMKSSGHRRNILNPSFRDIGIGFVKSGPGGRKGGMYTTVFGLRKR